MRNLANRVVLVVSCLGFSVAHAGTVPKALVLDLQRQDVQTLGKGLEDVFGRSPVQGRFDEEVRSDYWWGSVRIQGIAYSFNLSDIHVSPEAGRVRVDLAVTNLVTNIERISFNDSGSKFCRDVPMDTEGAAVPVGTDLTPWVDEAKGFHVAAANTGVGLNSDNFAVGRPAECHAIWGFNWLLRRVIPWTSGLVRDRVKEGIEQAIAREVDKLSAEYAKYLDVRVTLPFDAAPIPAFYATLGIWPDAVELTPGHLKFYIGADVEFDPDPRFEAEEEKAVTVSKLLGLGEQLPSYVGVARSLLEHVLKEANDKGLLTFDIGKADAGEAGELLTAGVVALMVPDATNRFDPEAPVELNFGGAASVDVSVDPDGGPGGIPIIDFCLQGLSLGFSVEGKPYYTMNVDARLSVALGFDQRTRRMKLIFQHLGVTYRSGAFAADLSPAPTDLTFNVDFLDFFVKQLNDRMAADGKDVLEMMLPRFGLGSRQVDFLGVGVREDFITLDATIRPGFTR